MRSEDQVRAGPPPSGGAPGSSPSGRRFGRGHCRRRQDLEPAVFAYARRPTRSSLSRTPGRVRTAPLTRRRVPSRLPLRLELRGRPERVGGFGRDPDEPDGETPLRRGSKRGRILREPDSGAIEASAASRRKRRQDGSVRTSVRQGRAVLRDRVRGSGGNPGADETGRAAAGDRWLAINPETGSHLDLRRRTRRVPSGARLDGPGPAPPDPGSSDFGPTPARAPAHGVRFERQEKTGPRLRSLAGSSEPTRDRSGQASLRECRRALRRTAPSLRPAASAMVDQFS